jgi:phosphoribosyl-ATP pyrophosphohydrolase/phosphoribosyl-AMP cyclohydrolase
MQDRWKVFNEGMIKSIRFERDGFLVDVILQNCITRDVLFGASMTKETLSETIEKGVVVLYSKNRKVRWLKGETSGDYLKIVSMTLNCERN